MVRPACLSCFTGNLRALLGREGCRSSFAALQAAFPSCPLSWRLRLLRLRRTLDEPVGELVEISHGKIVPRPPATRARYGDP